jgi:YgiT-type zinc finger domain-containing protein
MENKCRICYGRTFEEITITKVFMSPKGEKILIDNIPATVCVTCGEASFSMVTKHHIMDIVAAVSQKTLVTTRAMPVYEFAA